MGRALKQLTDCNRLELINIWVETFKSSPLPHTTQDMMCLIVGWEIQAKTARSDVRALKTTVNKLLRSTSSETDEVTNFTLLNPKISLASGTRLSRDWQGRTYVVDVLDKGFAFNGKLFSSLTPIAKTITGSHRSGPHFFGVST